MGKKWEQEKTGRISRRPGASLGRADMVCGCLPSPIIGSWWAVGLSCPAASLCRCCRGTSVVQLWGISPAPSLGQVSLQPETSTHHMISCKHLKCPIHLKGQTMLTFSCLDFQVLKMKIAFLFLSICIFLFILHEWNLSLGLFPSKCGRLTQLCVLLNCFGKEKIDLEHVLASGF